MSYTNSPLVDYTRWSPNHSGERTHVIDRITPHSVVGQCSVEVLGDIFANPNREASSNYGVGYDGRVGLYVPESCRSWCSSSNANDQRAITIEIATDTVEPYTVRDAAWATTIKLCADICSRNGKRKLIWMNDREATLAYEPRADEMILTVHKWFGYTSCPNTWIMNHMEELAAEVTRMLNPEPIPKKTFKDVTEKTSGYKQIMWAAENGIVKGYKDGTFRPSEPCTREQMCVMLYRLYNGLIK